MSDFITETGKLFGNLGGTLYKLLPSPREAQTLVIREQMAIPASVFIRLAGLSGAIAVSMGAYGAHGKIKMTILSKIKFLLQYTLTVALLHSCYLRFK